jgi:hypothetical protein
MRISTEKTENADIGMRLVLTKVPELTNWQVERFPIGSIHLSDSSKKTYKNMGRMNDWYLVGDGDSKGSRFIQVEILRERESTLVVVLTD